MLSRHPTISDCWTLRSPDGPDTPRVTVIGGLHGNEPCGVRAIQKIIDDPKPLLDRLKRGTVTLVIGNPKALEQGRRYTEGGADLNRLFNYRFVDEVPKARWGYEHHRALELREPTTEADAIIDLHSTSAASPAFAICATRADAVAFTAKLGCRIVYGWEDPDMELTAVSMGALVAAKKPAIAVECGQHDDASSEATATAVIHRFLGALGATDHDVSDAAQPHYRLISRVRRDSPHFRLAQTFASFTRLEPGDVVALDGLVSVRVERAAYVVMPAPQAEVGHDLVFLARLGEAGDFAGSE